MDSLVRSRQNDSRRCTKTIYSNCSTIHFLFDNNNNKRKSFSSHWKCLFSRIFDGVYASSNLTYLLPFPWTAQSADDCSSFASLLWMCSIDVEELLLFDRKWTRWEGEEHGLLTKVLYEKTYEEGKEKDRRRDFFISNKKSSSRKINQFPSCHKRSGEFQARMINAEIRWRNNGI